MSLIGSDDYATAVLLAGLLVITALLFVVFKKKASSNPTAMTDSATIYSPSYALLTEKNEKYIRQLMQKYSFAMVITVNKENGNLPFISHIPLIWRSSSSFTSSSSSSSSSSLSSSSRHGSLFGHVAKKNPQWRHFQSNSQVVAVFNGPHSYVSPCFYTGDTDEVPTWNYQTVHATGHARLLDKKETEEMIKSLIRNYESERKMPWHGDEEEIFSKVRYMLDGIVAFEIKLTNLEGKAKIGQNRSMNDFRSLHQAFSETELTTSDQRLLSEAMEQLCPSRLKN